MAAPLDHDKFAIEFMRDRFTSLDGQLGGIRADLRQGNDTFMCLAHEQSQVVLAVKGVEARMDRLEPLLGEHLRRHAERPNPVDLLVQAGTWVASRKLLVMAAAAVIVAVMSGLSRASFDSLGLGRITLRPPVVAMPMRVAK
jgi:hypothetical protein